MEKNRRPGKSSDEPTGDSSTKSDNDTLRDFCSSVPIEEISFEHWCQHHSKLDLQFPVTISRAQLQLPFRMMIRLSRSIRVTKGETRVDKREKIAHELIFEPGVDPPKTMVVKGLGDQLDSRVGDLWIIIHVKD